MIQETRTKLPIAEWARIMGINPLHFAGVSIPDIQRRSCDQAWFQYEWQATDRVGREEVARAIAIAEENIEEHIGYRLLPDWETDEWQPTSRPWRPELYDLGGRNVRGMAKTVEARWGHFISGGIRAKELVSEGAAVAWSSTKLPSTYNDTGTVTVATVALDPQEIAIYHPGKAGADKYQIRPITVSISAGVATITFARELAVTADIIESVDLDEESEVRIATGTDDGDFVATVDVYRLYNDPQQQVSFLWETVPSVFCSSCSGSGCTSCAYATQTGCLAVRGDPKISIVTYRPATWDSTTLAFADAAWAVGRDPDILRLYYYAGLRDRRRDGLERIEMDPQWARAVAYYAASLLDRAPCTCFQAQWERWGQDLAFIGGGEEFASYRISPADLDNPFGTRRGEVFAWKLVSRPGARIAQSIASR